VQLITLIICDTYKKKKIIITFIEWNLVMELRFIKILSSKLTLKDDLLT